MLGSKLLTRYASNVETGCYSVMKLWCRSVIGRRWRATTVWGWRRWGGCGSRCRHRIQRVHRQGRRVLCVSPQSSHHLFPQSVFGSNSHSLTGSAIACMEGISFLPVCARICWQINFYMSTQSHCTTLKVDNNQQNYTEQPFSSKWFRLESKYALGEHGEAI